MEAQAKDLWSLWGGPLLIHLPGKSEQTLVISTLLHGNETSGLVAIQKLIGEYQKSGREFEKSLSILIGNPEAAQSGVRHLDHQMDFNRIWGLGDRPEHRFSAQVIQELKSRPIFAAVDIHNTTGKNPHYACLNRIDRRFIHLAKAFSKQIVYFQNPKEVFSNAFSRYAPSVTLEGGTPGEPEGIEHIFSFLKNLVGLEQLSDEPISGDGVELYHSVAKIKTDPKARVEFGNQLGSDFDVCFIKNIDSYNFKPLPSGSIIGWRSSPEFDLDVENEFLQSIGHTYFDYHGQEIRLKRDVVPSLLTVVPEIVHQDCLGYFMERFYLGLSD